MIRIFLPFSVNCSQVTIFQIMSALCPHGQGKGGGGVSTKCEQVWTRGGGSQKFPNLCGHPLWMTPLSPDLNVLGLGKSEVYRSVFQLLLKDLPTRLTHLQVLLCQVFAFFLTLVLVYLARLLEFSLRGLRQILYSD